MLPLSKIKVPDLTQVMAGPFCCQLLADTGAYVTKVELCGGEVPGLRIETIS